MEHSPRWKKSPNLMFYFLDQKIENLPSKEPQALDRSISFDSLPSVDEYCLSASLNEAEDDEEPDDVMELLEQLDLAAPLEQPKEESKEM